MPEYPGGKKAFGDYIRRNLRYPDEALQEGIEGDVIVTYEVNDNGKVQNPKIKHGIGYGCDQEALRLISSLQFAAVTNRGMRVKRTFTTRIAFRLPPKKATSGIAYHVTPSDKKKEEKSPAPSSGKSYTWQIPVGGNENPKE